MMDASTLWAECAWRMHQLQTAAQYVREERRGRGLLVRLLRMMEALRAFVNETVLLGKSDESMHAPGAVLHDAALLVAAVGRQFKWNCPSRKAWGAVRRSRLQQELGAPALLQNNSKDEATGDTDCGRLRDIIISLREREQSLEFHRGLLLAVMQRRGDGNSDNQYSVDNFAYGSTPFDSWARVCSSGAIRCAIQRWPATDRTKNAELMQEQDAVVVTTPIAVVGSSIGSLVFFTAALLGHACTGIEILPYLHHVANELHDQHKPTNCFFLQADVLTTTLRGVRLVVLTSQCWDPNLYDLVLRKLENELRVGGIVVDYRDGLTASKCFQLAERVSGLRVSWNQAHSFFIYERCSVLLT
jgi:hypothetical protein